MKLITDTEYTKQYRELHANKKNYGSTGVDYYDEVCMVIDYLKPKVVLDYGCGKCALITELQQKYKDILFYGYDPSIPGLDKIPVKTADLIINTDVLEHIPEDILPNVIEKISSISQNVLFVINHALAHNTLPNGKNAHCTIKSPFWYEKLLKKYFSNINLLEQNSLVNSIAITFNASNEFLNKYKVMTLNNLNKRFKKAKRKLIKYKIISLFVKTENYKLKKLNKKTECSTICSKIVVYDYINRIKIKEFLKDKRIALVGNATSIFKSNFGDEIDDHDIIIRMNRGIILDKKSQGSRTDIWAGACNTKNKIENFIQKNFSPSIVFWTNPLSLYKDCSKNFTKKIFHYSDIFYNELKYDEKFNLLFENNKKPTTGFVVIDFILRHIDFKSLSIYGFDFFDSDSISNIANKGSVKNQAHNFTLEKQLIFDMIKVIKM